MPLLPFRSHTEHRSANVTTTSAPVARPENDPYGTVRDSRSTVFAWRKKMDINYLKHVQKVSD